MIGISYARSLTEKFSVGFNAKYAAEDLIRASTSTILFDAGLIFKTGFRSIQVGAVIRQFGPEVKFVESAYPIPQTFEIGLSGYLINGSDPLIFSSPENKLLVSYAIVHPRDYEQQQVFGIEYSWNDIVYLRGGYKFNFDEESYTLGFGARYQGVHIDYSYVPYGDFLNSVHRYTIGFSIK